MCQTPCPMTEKGIIAVVDDASIQRASSRPSNDIFHRSGMDRIFRRLDSKIPGNAQTLLDPPSQADWPYPSSNATYTQIGSGARRTATYPDLHAQVRTPS